MIRETNGSAAALRLCGCDPATTTSHRAQTVFRQALSLGDTAVFDTHSVSFSTVVSAIAAIEIASLFPGTSRSTFMLAGGKRDFDFEGFNRSGKEGNMFLADSVDYEEEAIRQEHEASALAETIIASGGNVMQARQTLPLSTSVRITVSGTLVDYFRFWRTVAPIVFPRHPDTRAFALDLWANLTVTEADFVEAARQEMNA